MADFISDEEMKKLEGQGDVISDEQMAAMEAQPTGKSWGETALDALPAAGTVAGGLVGSTAGPVGAIAGGGAGNVLGNDLRDVAKDYFGYKANPVNEGTDRALDVAGNFGTGAASSAIGAGVGAGLGKVGQFIKGGAQRFATSPLPQRIAEKSDITGRLGGNVLGRVGAYGLPGPLKYMQGASDSMRAVQGAQKGIAWALDHAPQSLGKYYNVLKQAAQTGSTGTVDFLLSQKDPHYQELKKKLNDQ